MNVPKANIWREESFREGDEFTVDCVLDEDVDTFLKLKNAYDPKSVGFITPVPRQFAQDNSKLGGFLRQAPASHYHKELGFCNWEVDFE